MGKHQYFLLTQLQNLWLDKSGVSWELIKVACGEDSSISNNFSELEKYTWNYVSHERSTFAVWRVVALSISRPDLLIDLISIWERQPHFDDLKYCTDWIYLARLTAKDFFKDYDVVDQNLKPWQWNDYASRDIEPDELYRRPLINKKLSFEEINVQVQQSGSLLRTLRAQDVKIEESTFKYYASVIHSVSPTSIMLLIELSKKQDFDQNIWIDGLLSSIDKIKDPIDLLYIVAGLINEEWKCPLWHSKIN
jgi:hypothetical protein